MILATSPDLDGEQIPCITRPNWSGWAAGFLCTYSPQGITFHALGIDLAAGNDVSPEGTDFHPKTHETDDNDDNRNELPKRDGIKVWKAVGLFAYGQKGSLK